MSSHFSTLPIVSCFALLGLLVASTPEWAEAQGVDSRIGEVTRRIPSMSPATGPHGTDVTIRADGLQPNTNYQIAFGEVQGCGYQICQPARSNARGEVATTLEVPEWAHTYHFEVVMILRDDLVPVAVSDPFHVSDDNGLVQREGVIGQAWPGCASLQTEDGVDYALVGPNARTLIASQGEAMNIEGRIVDGACTLQFAIEVESISLIEGGGDR